MVDTETEGEKSDSVNELDISPSLTTERFGRPLICIRTCSSTNDVAMKLADEGKPHGCTIVSGEQTIGRGRFGREWYSPVGGIWMSTIIRPETSIPEMHALPILCALAVASAIRTALGLPALVRWPNDVMLENRKIAGILVEFKSAGKGSYGVLGMGINSNFTFRSSSDPLALRKTSITIMEATGSPVDNARLISNVLAELERRYNMLVNRETDQLLRELKELDWSTGKRIVVSTPARKITCTFERYLALDQVEVTVLGASKTRISTAEVESASYVS